MHLARRTKITCESPNSFQDAIRRGVASASSTATSDVQNVQVMEENLRSRPDGIATYEVTMRVTLVQRPPA